MTAALGFLKAIPLWLWLALAAAGVIWWQHGTIQDARLQVQAQSERADQQEARADSLKNTLALQRDLQKDQEEVVNDARKQAEVNRGLAAESGRRAIGLQQQIRNLRDAAKARDSATPSGVAATGEVAGVFAGLLDESVGRLQRLAAEAEQYRAAGVACEASYSKLVKRISD